MKNLALNADFVVCLSIETTHPSAHASYRRYFNDDRLATLSKGQMAESASQIDTAALEAYKTQQGNNLPRLIHLDWTICSVKEFKV